MGTPGSGHPIAASEPTERRARKVDPGSNPEGGRTGGQEVKIMT